MKSKVKTHILLYTCYLVYSLSLVAAKFAGEHPLVSLPALSLYGVSFFLLGFFAIIWQQVLKVMPLTMAYANRAVVILYGMMWGALLFAEEIRWNMIIGAIIIAGGVVLMVMKRE